MKTSATISCYFVLWELGHGLMNPFLMELISIYFSTVFFLQKLAKSLFIYFAILHIIQLLNRCCLNEMPFSITTEAAIAQSGSILTKV